MSDTRPAARAFAVAELGLLAVSALTSVALLIRAGPFHPVTIEVAIGSLIYAAFLGWMGRGSGVLTGKARLAVGFLFALWFYDAVGRIVPALELPTHDTALNAADTALFGTTPAVLCQSFTTPWLTDLMSAFYLTYHVYLGIAFLHALGMPVEFGRRFGAYLFAGFGVGLAGYLLVPATGPWRAFPQEFMVPLTGGVLTQLNAAIVSNGSSVYDVFPSLHVLVTCCLLLHDWRYVRRRFWIMTLPCVGLLVSTVYLRYHYAVDLLAGFVCFGLVAATLTWPRRA